jgi:hypothetical protein
VQSFEIFVHWSSDSLQKFITFVNQLIALLVKFLIGIQMDSLSNVFAV